jgi:hypothetical protein
VFVWHCTVVYDSFLDFLHVDTWNDFSHFVICARFCNEPDKEVVFANQNLYFDRIFVGACDIYLFDRCLWWGDAATSIPCLGTGFSYLSFFETHTKFNTIDIQYDIPLDFCESDEQLPNQKTAKRAERDF